MVESKPPIRQTGNEEWAQFREEWLKDIDDYLAGNWDNVLLAIDAQENVLGFSFLDGDERPEGEYISYFAVRKEAQGTDDGCAAQRPLPGGHTRMFD